MKNTTRSVKFDEDGKVTQNQKTASMSSFLIKNKIVKNPQQASLLLLCIAIALSLIAFFIFSETQKEPVREYAPDPETFL